MLQFQTFKGKDDQFYFSLNTSERVILRSEGYSSAAGRNNGIESVKKNSTKFDMYESDDNNFTLKASNGQIIATSTIFKNTQEVQEAMNLVQKQAESAETIER